MTKTTSKTEQTDGLYAPGIVVAGVVSAVATFVAIVALQALYLSMSTAQQRAAAQNTINTSESLIAEQQARLNQYGWIDRSKNIVAIPIDEAIRLTAAELSRPASRLPSSTTSEQRSAGDAAESTETLAPVPSDRLSDDTDTAGGPA